MSDNTDAIDIETEIDDEQAIDIAQRYIEYDGNWRDLVVDDVIFETIREKTDMYAWDLSISENDDGIMYVVYKSYPGDSAPGHLMLHLGDDDE
ncbi:MAG: hypothetical protein ABEI52_03025, partial [Halobacteriaceae archaeon]